MTSSDTPKRAVIYARISQDKEGAGLGVAKQESDCRDLAARLGFDVIDVRSDNDLTAFKGGSRTKKARRGYAALLDDIRSRRAQAVIAWHTDRLHRDMAELEEYIAACGEGRDGVPTHTVRGGDLDLSTASGRMVARILGAVARQEVEHMIERQRSAAERNRLAGSRSGGLRPFGYRADGPSVKQGGDGRMVQVPEEAAAIRDACQKLLAGVPLRAIVKEWNAAGLRTPAALDGTRRGDGLFNARNMILCLTNPVHAGFVPHLGEPVGRGNWDPIIDEETWRAVRAYLGDKSRHAGGPGPKPRHLLTGVLICGVCGGRTFRTQPSQWGFIYQCASQQFNVNLNGMKRWHLGRQAEPLDAYVRAVVIERLSRPDVVAALNRQPEVDVAALVARRNKARIRLDELGAMFAADQIDGMQLAAGSAPLRAQIEEAETALSHAYSGSALEEFAGGADAEKVWDSLDLERRRTILKLLLRVRLHPVGKGGNRRGKKLVGGKGLGARGGKVPFDDSTIKILPPDA